MRFRIYILMAAAFLWLVFASVFMYRSTWTLKDAKFHKDIVVEMGMHHVSNAVPSNVYKFKLHGLDHDFVISRKKYSAYDTFVNNIAIGDTMGVYFEDWKHVEGQENNQVVQLEKGKLLLIDYSKRKTNDLIIAIVLYLIFIGFASFAFILNQRRVKQIKAIGQEFYGLGMYDKF
jgi:hypothetical protein